MAPCQSPLRLLLLPMLLTAGPAPPGAVPVREASGWPAAAAGGGAYTVDGYNAVMGNTCASDPSCTSVRDAGRAASAAQCEAMCVALRANETEPEPCMVFAWSASTHSCWLRTDGLWGAPGTWIPEVHRVSGCLAAAVGCGTNPLARQPRLGSVAVAASASAIEHDAADQLLFYLGSLGGWANTSRVPVVTVHVGYDASTARGGLDPKALAGLGDDGFVLVSNSSSGTLAVSGGRHSARGTLFGAYDLLRRLGCEFYAPDLQLAEELPFRSVSSLPTHLDVRVVPPIELRDSNEFGQTHHPRWAAKVGMNGPFASSAATKGAAPLFPSEGPFARFWTSDSYALVGPTPYPDPDLWAHHREWFWPRRDDSDNRTFGQLCWHNDSLVRFVTANIKQLLRANPNASVVMVAQEDNGKYCNDSAAQQIIQEEGTAGGPLFRAVNQIAAAIEPEFPHVMVQTLAYQWSRFPPRRTRPRKNVVIELCDINANFGAPLSDPSNAGFQRVLSGWARLTNGSDHGRLHVWNYVSSFSMPHVGCNLAFHDPVSCGMYIQPFPNYWVLGPNIQFFQRHGVSGVFEEGDDASAGGDMNALKNFVMARMLWDPTLDPDQLIEAFLRGYYRSAAPHIRQYMKTMHDAVQATGFFMNEGIPSNAPIYTPRNLLSCAEAMSAAVTVARSEPQRVQRRVDAAKLSTYYIVLVHWQNVTAYAAAANQSWPLERTKYAAWYEFTRVWNETALWLASGGGHVRRQCLAVEMMLLLLRAAIIVD